MEMKPTIDLYLEYCLSKQLRPKSMHAYEQGLRLFAVWLEEELEIMDVEDIRGAAIRKYRLYSRRNCNESVQDKIYNH